jgi:hypothetical protein
LYRYSFLWCIWYITAGNQARNDMFNEDIRWRFNIPWPVWATLFWGFSLASKFVKAYAINTKQSIENEYQKLKNKL